RPPLIGRGEPNRGVLYHRCWLGLGLAGFGGQRARGESCGAVVTAAPRQAEATACAREETRGDAGGDNAWRAHLRGEGLALDEDRLHVIECALRVHRGDRQSLPRIEEGLLIVHARAVAIETVARVG